MIVPNLAREDWILHTHKQYPRNNTVKIVIYFIVLYIRAIVLLMSLCMLDVTILR